ncbi:MAG: hypothetical protein ABJP70_05940 [Erythrobacter sp.]
MTQVDSKLHRETIELGTKFDQHANALKAKSDHRCFFTWSHGYITKKIGQHISLFNKPNDLMRLNKLFANDFLRTLPDSPHGDWVKAYKVCKGVMTAREAGFVHNMIHAQYGFELCAGCMAKVHINQDLKNALKKEQNVDAQDYGNVLILVNEGHFYAEKQLRGKLGATFAVMGQVPVMKFLKTSAERWRNDAWTQVMKTSVPKPTKDFATRYMRADGRG